MPDLLTASSLPDGFAYPPLFVRVVELGLTDLEPWSIHQGDALRARAVGLAARFPERELVPFAARQDNDDVACWEPRAGAGVAVVHDFASPGWETRPGFASFEECLRAALEDLIACE